MENSHFKLRVEFGEKCLWKMVE